MNDDTERLLHEYLATEEQKRREGKTIEALFVRLDRIEAAQAKITDDHDAVMRAVKRIAKDRLADKAKLDVHGRAIKSLQQQVEILTHRNQEVQDWRPSADEVTGVHALRDIAKAQQELEERWEEQEKEKKADATWWRRQGWIWAFAIVTLIVGAVISSCVGYVVHQLERQEAMQPRPAAPAPSAK